MHLWVTPCGVYSKESPVLYSLGVNVFFWTVMDHRSHHPSLLSGADGSFGQRTSGMPSFAHLPCLVYFGRWVSRCRISTATNTSLPQGLLLSKHAQSCMVKKAQQPCYSKGEHWHFKLHLNKSVEILLWGLQFPAFLASFAQPVCHLNIHLLTDKPHLS